MKAKDFIGHNEHALDVSVQAIRQVALPIDIQDATVVGFQVSDDGNRVWLCIDGVSVLRIKKIAKVEIIDMRPSGFVDTMPGEKVPGGFHE